MRSLARGKHQYLALKAEINEQRQGVRNRDAVSRRNGQDVVDLSIHVSREGRKIAAWREQVRGKVVAKSLFGPVVEAEPSAINLGQEQMPELVGDGEALAASVVSLRNQDHWWAWGSWLAVAAHRSQVALNDPDSQSTPSLRGEAHADELRAPRLSKRHDLAREVVAVGAPAETFLLNVQVEASH
jgi:hypothetical protein